MAKENPVPTIITAPEPHQAPGKERMRGTTEVTDREVTFTVKLPPTVSNTSAEAVKELFVWWLTAALGDAVAVLPKAAEYSADDLRVLGRELLELTGRDVTEMSRGELEQVGCYFYLQGKMARWHGAIVEGRAVSLDTLVDISIYTQMVRRIYDAGSWPGIQLAPK